MSGKSCRNTKAMIFIAMLVLAHTYQGQKDVGIESRQYSQSGSSTASPKAMCDCDLQRLMPYLCSQGFDKSVIELVETLMRDSSLQHGSLSPKQMDAVEDNRDLQEDAGFLAQQFAVLISHLSFVKQTMHVAEQIEAIITDMHLQENGSGFFEKCPEQAKRVAKHIEEMIMKSQFQENVKRVGKQILAITVEPNLQKHRRVDIDRITLGKSGHLAIAHCTGLGRRLHLPTHHRQHISCNPKGNSASPRWILRTTPSRALQVRLASRQSGLAKVKPTQQLGDVFLSRRFAIALRGMLVWSAGSALVRHQNFQATAVLVSRMLLLVYASAFASLASQAEGLIGPQGILPEAPKNEVRSTWDKIILGSMRRSRPGKLATLGGAVAFLAALLPSGRTAGLAAAATQLWLFMLYQAFVNGGSEFLRFQWDILLLESGPLGAFAALAAVPASPWGQGIFSALALSTVINLGFKLMWGSFSCKILSGCPEWRSGFAMAHHHRTTCLPKPLARILHIWTNKANWRSSSQVWATLLAEGPVSLLALSGIPHLRAACALIWMGLMAGIAVSGNYGFFNLHTSILAVALLEDSLLGPLKALYLKPVGGVAQPLWTLPFDSTLLSFALIVWAICTAATVATVSEACNSLPPKWAIRARTSISPFYLAGRYGLFAGMTTTRDEIIIRELHPLPEDLANKSGDLVRTAGNGLYWVELSLPYKPGPLDRAPPTLFTHMPRLDWQFWFASLQWARGGRPPRWFQIFLRQLSERSPAVVRLVEHAGQPKVQQYVLKRKPLEGTVSIEDYEFSERTNDTKLGVEWEQGLWWRRRVKEKFKYQIQ